MSRFTLEEYTDEEKRENGNMMKFGKLHDKICNYLEKEYMLKDSEVNDISMGVWLAIESLSPYKEFVEQQQSKLKAQQELIEEARETIEILIRDASSYSVISIGKDCLLKLAKMEANWRQDEYRNRK
jgi:hypothetical protein